VAAPRLGKKKSLVALQHNMLTAIWHMLTASVPYQDLGADYFDRLDPDRAKRRAIAQLHRLGYQVELTLAA
jgi:transposase